jgi:hypothetical protein
MLQAIRSTRPGGHVGYVGVAHGVTLPGAELFYSHLHLHGGPAPVCRFLPELIELIWMTAPSRARRAEAHWTGWPGVATPIERPPSAIRSTDKAARRHGNDDWRPLPAAHLSQMTASVQSAST